ncbi:hypothetical protein [Terrarubrum flagellatum]|uniref:helix-turn-helix domain-containing transcriptional regulator n=1 Tax=Terrirubrum flagellatum TaxID=2895980 RepID=UPI00314527B2
MAVKTEVWNIDDHFTTPESQLILLEDALETGDAGHIANVLGIIARARGIDVASVSPEAILNSSVEAKEGTSQEAK